MDHVEPDGLTLTHPDTIDHLCRNPPAPCPGWAWATRTAKMKPGGICTGEIKVESKMKGVISFAFTAVGITRTARQRTV